MRAHTHMRSANLPVGAMGREARQREDRIGPCIFIGADSDQLGRRNDCLAHRRVVPHRPKVGIVLCQVAQRSDACPSYLRVAVACRRDERTAHAHICPHLLGDGVAEREVAQNFKRRPPRLHVSIAGRRNQSGTKLHVVPHRLCVVRVD